MTQNLEELLCTARFQEPNGQIRWFRTEHDGTISHHTKHSGGGFQGGWSETTIGEVELLDAHTRQLTVRVLQHEITIDAGMSNDTHITNPNTVHHFTLSANPEGRLIIHIDPNTQSIQEVAWPQHTLQALGLVPKPQTTPKTAQNTPKRRRKTPPPAPTRPDGAPLTDTDRTILAALAARRFGTHHNHILFSQHHHYRAHSSGGSGMGGYLSEEKGRIEVLDAAQSQLHVRVTKATDLHELGGHSATDRDQGYLVRFAYGLDPDGRLFLERLSHGTGTHSQKKPLHDKYRAAFNP